MVVSSLALQSAASGAGYGARATQSAAPVAATQVGDRAAPGDGALPAQQTANTSPAPIKLTPEQVKAALQEFQQAVQKTAPGLEFSIDEDLGVTVVKLVDRQTKELVRQFPSEEMLNIAKSVDRMQGLLVSKMA